MGNAAMLAHFAFLAKPGLNGWFQEQGSKATFQSGRIVTRNSQHD
jgi:hypothetical protein